MTGQSTIQEVLFFPQMRPEKKVRKDTEEAYTTIGIPESWVPVIQKAGYLLVENLKGISAGKLHQELCGLNKKNKLELTNPTMDEVSNWLSKL